MTRAVDPAAVAVHAVLAAARADEPVGIFAESSSSMFYLTRALAEVGGAIYSRISTHYGSMGHANAGAIGFCAATGQRALVLSGDGSFHLCNPLPSAVKHDLRIATIVLNDARLALPRIGSASIGAFDALATTTLPEWDFTKQGSPLVGARRVEDAADLHVALDEALAFGGCFVVDVHIDRDVVPPVGARLASVAKLFGDAGRAA